MPDFEWSPEARRAVVRVVSRNRGSGATNGDVAEQVLAALSKAQPVVALPPCPACKGAQRWTEGSVGPQTVGMEVTGRTHVCPACNGSGVERLVPLSVLRDLYNMLPRWSCRSDQPDGCPVCVAKRILDEEKP